MINFWWRDAEPPLLTPLNALYHAVITMKNLPPASWRRGACFSAITFSATTAIRSSICPNNARGILGRRTPELVARVKKLLIDALSR